MPRPNASPRLRPNTKPRELAMKPSRADLIALLGRVVPEAFSRSLHPLRQSGAVECTRATITVTRTELLEQYARGERDTFAQ